MILGAHASIAVHPALAFERAAADTARSLQIFTRNARAWHSAPLAPEEARAFREAKRATGLLPIAHASYLVNLAAEGDSRSKSIAALSDELLRCGLLEVPALVVHPGGNADSDRGCTLVAEAVDAVFAGGGDRNPTRLLLECTAGQGSSLGHRFEQLATIIRRSENADRLGICLDTCHLHAAGYDLTSDVSYRATFEAFGRAFRGLGGLSRIEAFHLNDCKGALGCRVDRHATIGEGTLGLKTFARLVRDRRFAKLPGILETPEPERYRESLALLRNLAATGGASPRRGTNFNT